jgi:hypothetical protein
VTWGWEGASAASFSFLLFQDLALFSSRLRPVHLACESLARFGNKSQNLGNIWESISHLAGKSIASKTGERGIEGSTIVADFT